MSQKNEHGNKENKSSEKNKNKKEHPNLIKNNTNNSSFRKIKRISKNLISLAKDEISDIKKSNKDINIAKYDSNKEFLAPSSYTLAKKQLADQPAIKNMSSFKPHSKFESIQEKEKNNNNNEINTKEEQTKVRDNKGEISSSDISDDDE